MLHVRPGQSNCITLPLVNGGDPITSGSVTFCLVRLDTLESASTAGTHIANGHWLAEFAAEAWIEGSQYLCYAKESGGLHIPIGQTILCTDKSRGVLPNQANSITLPLVDTDGNPITTGDVTFTLIRLDSLLSVEADGVHLDNGHWFSEFAAEDWIDGKQYLCLAEAADGSQIPVGTQLLCIKSETPNAPVISVTAGTDSLTVSIIGDEEVDHIVLYKLASASAWSSGGIRTGDGTVVIADLDPGTYQVIAYSSAAGVLSAPSNLVASTILSAIPLTVNAYDAELIASARLFLECCGAIDIVYTPPVLPSRTIKALVTYGQIGSTPAPHGNATQLQITVLNTADGGIDVTELDTGLDLVSVPPRVGAVPTSRRILRLVNQDAGLLTLEVR